MTTGLPTGYKQFSLVVPKPSSRVKKGKNLFDIAFSFKNFGVGARFTRTGWQYPEPCYWTVTSVKPRKNVCPSVAPLHFGGFVRCLSILLLLSLRVDTISAQFGHLASLFLHLHFSGAGHEAWQGLGRAHLARRHRRYAPQDQVRRRVQNV